MTLLQVILSTTNIISIGSVTGIVGIVFAINRNFNNRLDKKANKSDVDDLKSTIKTMDERIFDLWKDRGEK